MTTVPLPPGDVAIVTGAASGIGKATAELLLADGWRVVAVDIDALRLDFPSGTPDARVLLIAADVSRASAVKSLFTEAAHKFGRVNAVVNSAGVTYQDDALIEDLSDSVFDQTQAVNLRGTFLMCKHAIPALRASRGGAIVNLGSVASLRGLGGAAYVSSKAGIAGLSRVVAAQYAAENIRCNTVAPGPTATPMLDIVKRKATFAMSAMPGIISGEASPSEVAALIKFLISAPGRFITGAIYTIDGGLTQH
jgi:NAD(P)-dependent dehydrogenase (short-subunit alcohol dehydrogenase family)